MCTEKAFEVNDNLYILIHNFDDDSRQVIDEDGTVFLSIDSGLVVRNSEKSIIGRLQYMNGEYEYRTGSEIIKTGVVGEIGYKTILAAEVFAAKCILQKQA